MGDLINIADHKPHLSGIAKCLQCGHEWEAVAPVGSASCLECENCHTYKGVMKGLASPDVMYMCNCGNDVFYVGPDGPMCCLCGLVHYDLD
jgi:hypothetical protein